MDVKSIRRLYIIACGTSWHAGLVGKFLFEEFFGVPTEVDLASEFRYRNPLVGKNDLAIAISQSGETADNLARGREVNRRGGELVSVCNVMESSLTREGGWAFMTHAAPANGARAHTA